MSSTGPDAAQGLILLSQGDHSRCVSLQQGAWLEKVATDSDEESERTQVGAIVSAPPSSVMCLSYRRSLAIIRRLDCGKEDERGDFTCEVPGCGWSLRKTVRSTARQHGKRKHAGMEVRVMRRRMDEAVSFAILVRGARCLIRLE
jgi:hypothetical protein